MLESREATALNWGETIRNLALLGLVVFVVGPCAYRMMLTPSEDQALVDSARSAVGGDFSDGWIVSSDSGHGRAVCGVKSGVRFVYREGAQLASWDDGEAFAGGAVESWCKASSRLTALQPDGRL